MVMQLDYCLKPLACCFKLGEPQFNMTCNRIDMRVSVVVC